MKVKIGVIALFVILVSGCGNREQELQQRISQLQTSDSTMQQGISDRDKYMEQVIAAVNDAYTNLEKARVMEGGVAKRSGGVEGSSTMTNVVTRDNLLNNLRDISTALKENRKRIGALQSQSRGYSKQIAGLDTLIDNLKASIAEREESIAQLQARVQGLEANVAENTKTIAHKDSVIDDQRKTINTAYYVVGTKDELEKKGIITNEGGFLWGLLGSTTVLSDSVSTASFEPIDGTTNQSIHVNGTIDEILPSRTEGTFATDETGSALTILRPSKFWQQRLLVIVVKS